MTEQTLQCLIVVGGLLVGVPLLMIVTGTKSTLDNMIEAWKERALAKLKIEEAKQLHLQNCPRLSDPDYPRLPRNP